MCMSQSPKRDFLLPFCLLSSDTDTYALEVTLIPDAERLFLPDFCTVLANIHAIPTASKKFG